VLNLEVNRKPRRSASVSLLPNLWLCFTSQNNRRTESRGRHFKQTQVTTRRSIRV